MSGKVALITGITGQDGSYLAELLLEKGYTVHGIIRRSSSFNTGRIDHIYGHKRLHLIYGDMTDGSCLTHAIATIKPHEIYNLAAQSHVKVSFEMPEYTATADGVGVLKILNAIRACELEHHVRFYQASTSELYGLVQEIPQSETTPFYPRSPYAAAKMYGYWITVNYREAYGMFAVNGILFNHESPRRGATFVTRKICREVARIHHGLSKELRLGNLNALRDWGHARDYVEAMWLMLQHDTPEDFVIATGEQHSVREFCEICFEHVGVKLQWSGEGVDELGEDAANPQRILVRVDERYFRPTEVETLLGKPDKAKQKLGWTAKTSFADMVKEMMDSELQDAKAEAAMKQARESAE
eukprot:NODE_791_length_1195_cov_90.254682_g750_i0.p1 GENE.NODE_791_length_1195_cov_90.254682_g750_i0~~NODE_791_length_1195_cov_90.254682_g750_i0.p1  ORF type:complete len:356 (-),score=61.39 NODE_791_length_1195_cov_90.254682_g750_i0:66-1133(-)